MARGHVKVLRAADLSDDGPDELDTLIDPSPPPWEALATAEGVPPVLVRPGYLRGLGRVWGPDVVGYDPARVRCPVCHDRPLRKVECCLVCGASGELPEQHPMQSRLPRGESWDGSPHPRPLAGGMGGLAEVARAKLELRARARALRRARDGHDRRPAA